MNPPTHLVVVCCHGIWTGGPTRGAAESEWLIAPFQAGETPTFMEHVKAGLVLLAADRDAVLMFSGAATRKESNLSEAQSYASLVTANSSFHIHPTPLSRIHLEERALDSYHNILFSLAHFHRLHSTWPARLTIVSHAFKRPRIEAHVAAIGFPAARTAFVGIDPPGMAGDAAAGKPGAVEGVKAAVGMWEADPHGVGGVLAGKRRERNPWGVRQDLFLSEDERRESGVGAMVVDGVEVLDPDAPRPWA